MARSIRLRRVINAQVTKLTSFWGRFWFAELAEK
ncbi:Uncharacterised protein [Vibrio cholerae]|nr:Uncharacterised protein [Vibrio cholerae]